MIEASSEENLRLTRRGLVRGEGHRGGRLDSDFGVWQKGDVSLTSILIKKNDFLGWIDFDGTKKVARGRTSVYKQIVDNYLHYRHDSWIEQ